jgi:hypothetical protein
MKEREHLLIVLAEECAEVAQRASKALRFGLAEIQPGQPDDNLRRLEREFSELYEVASMLRLKIREEDRETKREKLKKFMDYSRQLGTLE